MAEPASPGVPGSPAHMPAGHADGRRGDRGEIQIPRPVAQETGHARGRRKR